MGFPARYGGVRFGTHRYGRSADAAQLATGTGNPDPWRATISEDVGDVPSTVIALIRGDGPDPWRATITEDGACPSHSLITG